MLKEFVRVEDGLSKDEKKQYLKSYQDKLTVLQQDLKTANIPVIVVVDGQALSGKAHVVNELISELDPRFSSVLSEENIPKEAKSRPFIEPYFNAIPENGKFLFVEGGWTGRAVDQFVRGKISEKQFERRIESIKLFERQLVNNGYLLVKLFLNVSKDRQKKNLVVIETRKANAWVDEKKKRKLVKLHDEYLETFERALGETNDYPWTVIDTEDRTTMDYDAFKCVYEQVAKGLKKGKFNGKPYKEEFDMVKMSKLKDVDLSSCKVERAFYKEQLKEASERIKALQGLAAEKGITALIAFEGWDAAGKGSAIRRLAYPLDPRLFTVFPIASPEKSEKARHHLWRFWQRMPRTGQIAIFDRTWYGRCMVERLEGFCTENDWKRSYAEINEFEKELSDWGAVIIKFWIQIDKNTQLARFTDRQNTPEKQWKITDEDWRNREKWDLYEKAIDEMIAKTSTRFAPWTIVEGNDKLYARLKVLNTVADRLEKALEEK